jgi:hypothetical protein
LRIFRSAVILRGKRVKVKHFLDSVHKVINTLIVQSKKLSLAQLTRLIALAGAAPFAGDLLEVDSSLWGSFWQGDVIAPGYRLPALELALLRATRLEQHWPEGTSVGEFVAALQQAVRQPGAGVWTLRLAGEPCAVFATASRHNLATVVWYCAGTGQLHAGYRAAIASLNFGGAVEQRPLGGLNQAQHPQRLTLTSRRVSPPADLPALDLAARLDAEILRLRA